MLITHSKKPARVRTTALPAKQDSDKANAEPQESFVSSAGRKALDLLKTVGKSAKKYVKPALIAAAPALATAVAAGLGGVPAAALAIVGSGVVGAAAGAAVWGPEIGYIKGIGAGGLAGMFSATLGAVGAVGGVTGTAIAATNLAAIGATREVILRHLADVPKTD